MPKLYFTPIFPDEEPLVKACEEYKKIWREDGERIIKTLENLTRFKFIEKKIGVVVYEGMSLAGMTPSGIIRLRASYNYEIKKGTLVHELGHRILFNIKMSPKGLNEHKVLNLFLYDAWVEIYGENFANQKVTQEKALNATNYKEDWDWVFQFKTKKERQVKFRELMKEFGK